MWEAQCIAVTWHRQEVLLASRFLIPWVTPFTVFHISSRYKELTGHIQEVAQAKKMKAKFPQEKSMICIPTCFLQQCWILWSIKALKWLSGSCGGFGTLAKAWFAWNMDRSLGARAQPAFLSIYLKLQKHHDDQSIQGEIISNGRFVFDFSFLWQRGQKFLYSVFVCFSVSGQFLLMVDSQLLLNFRPRLQV